MTRQLSQQEKLMADYSHLPDAIWHLRSSASDLEVTSDNLSQTPGAANLEKTVDAELHFYQMLRAGLMAFARGMEPMIAVEFSRRAVPHDMRPGFKKMEAACKGGAAAVSAEAA
jgi:hypothetical protein